jgi:hypothetical protein
MLKQRLKQPVKELAFPDMRISSTTGIPEFIFSGISLFISAGLQV